MATITFGKSGTRPYCTLEVTQQSQSVANNTSTVKYVLTLVRPSTVSSTATKSWSCTINGTKHTGSGSIGGSGNKVLLSGTQTIPHNADGTKTLSFSGSCQLDITWSGTKLGTISGSGSMTLTKIARYATVTQTSSGKTETTVSIKWVSDSIVDYIWYSSNNGSSWTGINVTDGTNGSYTISGLSADTNYKIKTRVRRKDSQLTTDSTALSVTTYAYPYATTMPSFTIGSKLTLGFFNPLGRSITVNILGADGSQISNDTTTGTSISGYNGSVVQERLYQSIPNAKSGTYRVKVTYGSIVTTKTGGTYTVNQNVCLPSIEAVSYKDINSATIALTDNDKDIIRNHSVVQYSASGLAAQKSASVVSCSVTVNGDNYNLTLSGDSASGNGSTIDSGQPIEAVFTVTDSRGLTATKSITVNMLDWQIPSAIITLARQHNYYSATDITVDADYSSINGNNQVTITYEATEDNTARTVISGTLTNNVTSTITLDNEYAWTVAVTITDSLGGTVTYNLTLSRGMPIIFFDRIKSSVGINCFPNDDKSFEVNGVSLPRSVMSRSLSADTTNLTINSYTVIPLTVSDSFGGKLTGTEDGGIQIGANVSKVLVSGRASFNCGALAGNRHIRIIKNTYSANNTLGWAWEKMESGASNNLTITPFLADVQEGDVIYMVYYVPIDTDKLGGNAYGGRTSVTVETVG